MKKIYTQNETLFLNGFLIGLICFFITFIITFLLQLNEMSLLKIAFLPFVFGFFYFFIFVIYTVIFLNKYNKKIFLKGEVNEKRFKQILIVFVVSFLSYYILDCIVFLFDSSLSQEFADGLLKITENPTAQEMEEINALSKMPFSVQNFILNIISAFFSILFAYIFVKKSDLDY
jgi:hypothetical protein